MKGVDDEDRRLAAEALRGHYVTTAQLDEARAIQDKFNALGLARRSLGEIFLQRGYTSRHALRELYRKISPDVDLPRIGGYQVVAKVGEGGMGAVYEARQTSLDRRVALKILHPSLAEDELYLRRFVREAQAVALLNHPNIVGGIDVGSEGKLHYFVMEFVEGQTVKELLREEGFLPEKLSFDIARQVALALDQASRHGLVHRDIKPENVILTEQNVAKLCDLGLARPEGSDDTLTESGATHGTPFYMSPEQACGEPIDVRSDIYALGVTLYEMVTGERPFGGRTAAEVLIRQISDPPISPRKRNGLLSPGAERVILKMMAKRPAERYQDARALAADLEDVTAGRMPQGVKEAGLEPTHRVTQESRSRRMKSERRRRLPLQIALVVLGLYAAAVSWKAFRTLPPREPIVLKGGAGPTPPAPRADPDHAAQRLFRYAQDYERRNPSSTERIRERYQQVAARFPRSYWGFQAQEQLDLLDAASAARAQAARRDALEALRKGVRALVRQGQFGLAFERIERHAWDEAQRAQRAALKDEVQSAAATALEALLEAARQRIARKRPLEAIALVESFLAGRPPIDRSRADQVLLAARAGLAQAVASRREAVAERQDRLLYEAYTGQREALRRYQIEQAHRALGEQAARSTDRGLARRLRWLGQFLRRGGEYVGAAQSALAAGKGRMTRLFDREQKPVVGRLQSVAAGVIVLRAGGGQRTIALADQPPELVAYWAGRAEPQPAAAARAAFLAAAGRLDEAQRLLAAADDPVVELLAILRRHAARELLARFSRFEADGKSAEALDALEELLEHHADTAPVADELAALAARRRQLRQKLATSRVEPAGRILARQANRLKLSYRLAAREELADWRLGPRVRWTKGVLRSPGKGAGATFRFPVAPPLELRYTVVFLDGQEPGLGLAWEQPSKQVLRLSLDRKGMFDLHWAYTGNPPSRIPLAARALPLELLGGIYNVRLVVQEQRLLLYLDARLVAGVELKQAPRAGRLSLLAPAGGMELRGIMLEGSLSPE